MPRSSITRPRRFEFAHLYMLEDPEKTFSAEGLVAATTIQEVKERDTQRRTDPECVLVFILNFSRT